MAIIDRNLEIGVSKDLKELIGMAETHHEVRASYLVLKEKLGGCRDYTISPTEAKMLGVDRAGLLAGLLGAYKEYLKNDTGF